MSEHEFVELLDVVGLQAEMNDLAPIQMWSLTNADTYGRVNRRHAEFLGRDKQDLEFRSLRDIFPAAVAEVCEQSNREVVQHGKAVVTREALADAKGSVRLLEITKTPSFDDQGRIRQIVCFAFDVTEESKVAADLSRSEANFRTLVETITDIVVIGDPGGRLLYANPAATAALGFGEDELRGMHILDLHADFARDEAAAILTDMFHGKRSSCPLPLQAKNGALVPVETRIWHGKWSGNDCIFGISKAISKEQDALQKFDRFFRMNPTPMAVNRLPDRTFCDVNDAFLKLLGYEAGEVLGKSSGELGLFVDAEAQVGVSRMLAERGNIREVDLRVRARDGRILDGQFSGEIIESQGVKYFLTVMVDITERQETMRELRAALAEITDLRDILPICSSCKKIRDDGGYWEQVEAYVSRYTGAQFSHGMCPDCMTRLYPDLGTGGRGDTAR